VFKEREDEWKESKKMRCTNDSNFNYP
jgi:hypothetical protein